MSKNSTKDWFQIKNYPHLTPKLSFKNRGWVETYVSNKGKISTHTFFPLIHREVVQRRYKKFMEINLSTRSHYDYSKNKSSAKIRHIYYATHLDAQIHSYYAKMLLSPLYESLLASEGKISECICAYRFVETNNSSKKGKSNIHFANDVFEIIRKNKECIVLSFDIEEFFDSLNHEHLKKCWCNLLNQDLLPSDHYNLYKSLTNFSFVEETVLLRENSLFHMKDNGFKLRKELNKIESFCKNIQYYRDSVCGTNNHQKKSMVNSHPFRYKNREPDFKENLRKGIPQGTAMSAFLANLYMFDFDKVVFTEVENHNGLYRRYSDDIIIICPNNIEIANKIKSVIINEIIKYHLVINEAKTEICTFSNTENKITCDKPLRYLGFEFDGTYTRLKSTSLAKYYRRMKKYVKYKVLKTSQLQIKNQSSEYLFKKQLYKKYSHLGKYNYIHYAIRASKILHENKIENQIKRHWKNLNQYIDKLEKRFNILKR
jgi:Reverse transcriptase (RNA-dependent DNA polymerase)